MGQDSDVTVATIAWGVFLGISAAIVVWSAISLLLAGYIIGAFDIQLRRLNDFGLSIDRQSDTVHLCLERTVNAHNPLT